MAVDIAWADCDGSELSLHFDPVPTWSQDVEAVYYRADYRVLQDRRVDLAVTAAIG
jgi:hypothetical protein